MGFVIYDLAFLIIFTLFVVTFLYTRKHNLKKEGLLYLYRTKFGIEFIEWTTKKYPNLLKKLQYLVLFSGYSLLIAGIYFIVKVAYYYVTSPYLAKALKVPVIMPLIPYLPELFNLDFLPPFYFTYWIIIIAIIAVPHEFAHGIFARLNNIPILSTGFGFLGPFLAAFVEQDEKKMQKASKFAQLSVLAAGTFANIIFAAIFGLILIIFFSMFFVPAGVQFNTYSLSLLNSSQLEDAKITGNYLDNSSLAEIKLNNAFYFTDLEMLNNSIKNNLSLGVYDSSPALKAKLSGAIAEINGIKIASYNDLNQTLSSLKPGDNIIIKTINKKGEESSYNITLSERGGRTFLGIGLTYSKREGMFSFIGSLISKFKDPFIYYESKIGDIGIFILDLLWWTVVISLSVALVNMLPLGIFDGGRFFMLTIWAITGRKRAGEVAYKISTWFFLALLALMMVKWFFAIAL